MNDDEWMKFSYANMPVSVTLIMWHHALWLSVSYRAFISSPCCCNVKLFCQDHKRAWGCAEVFPLSSGNYVFSYLSIVTSQDCSYQLDVELIGWNCVDLCRAVCQRQPQCVQTYGLFLLTVWRAFGKEVFSFGAGCRLNMLYL